MFSRVKNSEYSNGCIRVNEKNEKILKRQLIDLEQISLTIKSNDGEWRKLYEIYFPGIEVAQNCCYFEAFVDQYIKIFRAGINSSPMLAEQSYAVRDDERIVYHVVSMKGCELKWATPRLQENEYIVRTAVENDCHALQFSKHKDNPQMLNLATKRARGYALEHASERLKDNYEIVKEIVSSYGLALQHASPRLRQDLTIVFTALINNSFANSHVHAELRNNDFYKKYLSIKSDENFSQDEKRAEYIIGFFQLSAKSARNVIEKNILETVNASL